MEDGEKGGNERKRRIRENKAVPDRAHPKGPGKLTKKHPLSSDKTQILEQTRCARGVEGNPGKNSGKSF